MEKEADVILLVENARHIDILKNLWDVHKAYRESYYFLLNLRHIMDFNIFIPNRNDKTGEISREKIKILAERVKQASSSFNELEATLGIDVTETQKKTEDQSNHINQVSLPEIFHIVHQSIKLKTDVDELRNEIILYLIELAYESTNNITESIKDNPYFDEMNINFATKNALENAFECSERQDKMDTYVLNTDTDWPAEEIEILKEKGIVFPYYLKYRDYTYNIEKNQKRYRNYYEHFINLSSSIDRFEHQLEIVKLTREQSKINRNVQRLTITTVILALFSLITSIVSIYCSISNITVNN
ncbi:MAG: hypothetical protein AAGU75_00305 [Bacillota bacterium]